MFACGDLKNEDDYINPVICDFLLFATEWILNVPLNDEFPWRYDNVTIICSRKRGDGSQQEYLLQINISDKNEQIDSALNRLLKIVQQHPWNGFKLM